MSNFAFYEKVVALNSEVHRSLKFDTTQVNFSFVRDTTAVLIAVTEFAEAGREYPIVFIRGQDQQLRPVVLLGVRDGENLFVDSTGRWNCAYIPAFVRRYPFVLGKGTEPEQLVVCIDESCLALNTERGEPLMDATGQPQPILQNALQFLQNFLHEFARTEALTKQLDELGLFVKQGVRFDAADGAVFQINDFYTIDEAKFNQIDDEALPPLFRSGAMGLGYLHLASMGNMRKLLNLVNVRAAAKQADQQAPKKKLAPLKQKSDPKIQTH